MAFWMTPITLPGISIRPPNSPPGSKNIIKKKKTIKNLLKDVLNSDPFLSENKRKITLKNNLKLNISLLKNFYRIKLHIRKNLFV